MSRRRKIAERCADLGLAVYEAPVPGYGATEYRFFSADPDCESYRGRCDWLVAVVGLAAAEDFVDAFALGFAFGKESNR